MNDDIVNRLRKWAAGAEERGREDVSDGLRAAADTIVRLRAQRDEARRLHCYGVAATIQGRTAEYVAKRLAWDCFKGAE